MATQTPEVKCYELNTRQSHANREQFSANLRILRVHVPCGHHVADILFVQSHPGHTTLCLPGVPAGLPNQDVYRTAGYPYFKAYRRPHQSLSE